MSDVFELEGMLAGTQKLGYEHYRSVNEILTEDEAKLRSGRLKRDAVGFLAGFSCLVDFFDFFQLERVSKPSFSLEKEVTEVLRMLDMSAKDLSEFTTRRQNYYRADAVKKAQSFQVRRAGRSWSGT